MSSASRRACRAVLPASAVRLRLLIVAAAGAAVLAALILHGPIRQDPAYHDFADRRALFGIPNAADVLSNLAFLLAGLRGLFFMARSGGFRRGRPFRYNMERLAWTVLFTGTALTGLGSAWYHLDPESNRLLWDRLPMTAAFMALFSIVIAERISHRAGRRLLWPLILLGAASVIAWRTGDACGEGDLRFYAMVQYFPLIAILLMLILFPARYTGTAWYFGALAWYGLAKTAELLDGPIFALGGIASGHTLKHILAAVAVWWLVRMLKRREPLPMPAGRA